jgi:hypothetical protein
LEQRIELPQGCGCLPIFQLECQEDQGNIAGELLKHLLIRNSEVQIVDTGISSHRFHQVGREEAETIGAAPIAVTTLIISAASKGRSKGDRAAASACHIIIRRGAIPIDVH